MGAASERQYVDDVPDEVEARLRAMCLALPDAYEESAWVGTRWMVRKKTFAHVLTIDDVDGARLVLTSRAAGDDLEVLTQVGHPYYLLGWGRDAMGMVLDDATDWDEVREIVTDSFCVMAPKRLVALVDRPDPVE